MTLDVLRGLLVFLAAFPLVADVYLGSKACAGCHRKIHDDYMRGAMARSLRLPTDAEPRTPVMVHKPTSNRYHRVFRDADGMHQSQTELDSRGNVVFRSTHRIEYVVGSGVNGSSYIVRRGDWLFQAPLSFYSRTQSWDLSPGYEQKDLGFSRPIVAVCTGCHSGRPQVVPNRDGQYRDPPFLELGVGCENCHGPGEGHVAASGKGGIVNPAKLSAPLAEDICLRCHQDGDARVLQPGKQDADFRPGTPLQHTVAIFKIPLQRDAAPDSSDLLEHHFAMKLSKCYLDSGGRLGCLSCHNPHSIPARDAAASWYRGKCLTCHSESACSLPRSRRGPADDCAACHMPKRNVQQVAHSALTLHRIVRRPRQSYPEIAFQQATRELPDLVYLNGSPRDLPRLTLLQAYAALLERQPAYLEAYMTLLEELRKTGSKEPFVLAALGRRALRESDPRAVEYLSDAIRAGAISPIPYQDLADALVRAGRDQDAIRALRQGLDQFPYSPVLQKLLAVRYIALKQYGAARDAITDYLKLFPEDSFMREMLRKFDAAAYSNRNMTPR